MNTDFLITEINRIVLVGKEEYPEKIVTFNPDIYRNELIFNFSGVGTVYFGDQTLHTYENTIRFLPKGNAGLYRVEKKHNGECILITFDTSVPISDKAFVIEPKNAQNISNLFRKIFAVWVSKNEGYYFECLSLLYKIFAELQKHNYIPENQYDTIKIALRYIEENFLKENISVSFLAQKCGISESYLKKLFIKKSGLSPVKYIIQLKINHACDLLRAGTYTITEISEICGYDDVGYFSRQFKKYTGITPTEFKNKYKSSK